MCLCVCVCVGRVEHLNNLSVISRRCLATTGNSMLTFILSMFSFILPMLTLYCQCSLLYNLTSLWNEVIDTFLDIPSYYTDTNLKTTSPRSIPKIRVPSGEELVPLLTSLV